VASELQELSRFEKLFRDLVAPNPASPFFSFVEWLHLLEVKTIFPLVLYVWCDAGLTEQEALGCFEDLLSYVVRRLICKRETRSYSSLFTGLVGELKGANGDAEPPSRVKLQKLLLKHKNDSNDWPTDAQFETAWLTTPAYVEHKASRIEKILLAIEVERRTRFNEAITVNSRLSVEHVMPQKWYEHWPLADGRTGRTPEQRFLDGESDPPSEERERLVHSFGNLTLLTQPLNSSISNSGFPVKRVEIAKQSAFGLNRYFVDMAEWDVDQMRTRGKALFESALRLWPRPAS
jgi:hypothetical protein